MSRVHLLYSFPLKRSISQSSLLVQPLNCSCSEKGSYVAKKYKSKKLKSFYSITALREEKRKRLRVWPQLCFQMCQGSGVKDKSTRMWCTLTRNQFAVCAFLTGGGRRAECLAFLLSTTPSERPHFAAVNYDTATSCPLLWQCLPMALRRNVKPVKHSGWKTSGEVVFEVLAWLRGPKDCRWPSPRGVPHGIKIVHISPGPIQLFIWFTTKSLIRNLKRGKRSVQCVAG